MIAVVGDIHGCYFTFLELVDKIKSKYPEIEIYSVGDLIDRGKFSYEVVEYFKNGGGKFCLGNHELMFLNFFNQTDPQMSFNWTHNGYETTLYSYELHKAEFKDHLEFLKGIPLYFNLTDCFISHAGISIYYKKRFGNNLVIGSDEFNKNIKRTIADPGGIIWTRDELMDIGKLQVVGHSRQSDIVFSEFNKAVYIDTSAYGGNGLSAIIVDESKIVEQFFVKTYYNDIY